MAIEVVSSTPLIVGVLILLASIFSLRIGVSVAIIEVVLGVIAGAFGLVPEEWMLYFASFGAVLLTFLAGTEIDTALLKEKLGQSMLIGLSSFIVPFAGIALFTRYVFGWDLSAALIAGAALSTASLAIVYSILMETGLSRTRTGKLLMASTFIADMATALALSILFIKPTLYTLIFILVSVIAILIAVAISHHIFENPKLKNKVIEPEIKYIFLLILVFMFFAGLGDGHAVLPAFLLGLLMSKHFEETEGTLTVRNRLRTVAYAVITPIFFIVSGLRVSLPLILASLGAVIVLFLLQQATKFLSVYFLARRFIPHGSVYTTLLMSTGLTFGLIASLFGLTSGFLDQVQYSVLTGVVIASAAIPTFVAQKWFFPQHEEDLIDMPAHPFDLPRRPERRRR